MDLCALGILERIMPPRLSAFLDREYGGSLFAKLLRQPIPTILIPTFQIAPLVPSASSGG
jgi:hypothetical protein